MAKGTELTLGNSLQGLATYQKTKPKAPGGEGFLKINHKTGDWIFGQRKTKVHKNDIWVISPTSIQHGVVAWHQGGIEFEKMVAFNAPAPDPASFPAVKAKNGIEDQRGFTLACIDGPNMGEQVVFKTNSKGGIRAHEDVVAAIVERVESGEPAALYPVVVLDSDSYTHKEYGEIYTPLFEIVDWSDNSGEVAAEPDEEEAAPKSRKASRKKKPAPEPVEEIEDDYDEDDDEDDYDGGDDYDDEDDVEDAELVEEQDEEPEPEEQPKRRRRRAAR